jgi:hypothetical protein
MTTWAVAAASLVYVGLLFATAWWADKRPDAIARSIWRPYIYGFSLAVYCTSWTFFGAVGTAASQGWNYLPIYLGPALMFLFGHRILRRIVEVAKRENITSIADFISSRYGKSQSVAVLVVTVPDDVSAFRMFETLNDRGLKASQADILKNYFFSKTGARYPEAQMNWGEISNVVNALTSDDSDDDARSPVTIQTMMLLTAPATNLLLTFAICG